MTGSSKENRFFPLLKYFSRISLVFIVIVAVVLAVTYRNVSVDTLITYGERSNVVLTQAVSNTIWPAFKSFAPEAARLKPEQLKQHPRIEEMNRLVNNYVKYTPILKVKIFDLNGKTIFSTDAKQLGEQKPAEYGGSISAKTGRVISELEFKERFMSVSGELTNRTIVSSYLPIRDVDTGGAGIVGVVEVYFDVTDQFEAIKTQQMVAFLVIFVLLMMLYAALFIIVRRADRIIYLQSLSLKSSLGKIEEKNAELNEAYRYS